MGKTKWVIIWALLYALSIFWVMLLLNKINIPNYLVSLIIAGVVISLFSIVYKLFLHQNSAHLTWYLFYSIAINTFNFWLFNLFAQTFNIGLILNLIIGGMIFETVWQISHRVPKTRVNKIIFPAALILVLIVTNFYILEGEYSSVNALSQSGANINLFDKLNSLFSKVNDARCPQLDIKISPDHMYIESQDYNRTKIFCYNYRESLFGYSISCQNIQCYKGMDKANNAGLNIGYTYCGDRENLQNLAGFEKTIIHTDGTIGETVRRSFMNVYDENLNFIETKCGSNPDNIIKDYVAEQEAKAKKELKQFIGDIKDIAGA